MPPFEQGTVVELIDNSAHALSSVASVARAYDTDRSVHKIVGLLRYNNPQYFVSNGDWNPNFLPGHTGRPLLMEIRLSPQGAHPALHTHSLIVPVAAFKEAEMPAVAHTNVPQESTAKNILEEGDRLVNTKKKLKSWTFGKGDKVKPISLRWEFLQGMAAYTVAFTGSGSKEELTNLMDLSAFPWTIVEGPWDPTFLWHKEGREGFVVVRLESTIAARKVSIRHIVVHADFLELHEDIEEENIEETAEMYPFKAGDVVGPINTDSYFIREVAWNCVNVLLDGRSLEVLRNILASTLGSWVVSEGPWDEDFLPSNERREKLVCVSMDVYNQPPTIKVIMDTNFLRKEKAAGKQKSNLVGGEHYRLLRDVVIPGTERTARRGCIVELNSSTPLRNGKYKATIKRGSPQESTFDAVGCYISVYETYLGPLTDWVIGSKVEIVADIAFKRQNLKGKVASVLTEPDEDEDIGLEFTEEIKGGSLEGLGEEGRCLFVPVKAVKKA